MGKGKGGSFQTWEATYGSDRFVRISNSMMKSKAWQELSIMARYLYLEMKACYHGGKLQEQAIVFTYKKAETVMHKATFQGALHQLIECGFITVTFNGYRQHMPNQYGFSDAWQRYPRHEPEPRKLQSVELKARK